MKDTDLLTVSEVARRSGFAASALRFYEREQLIGAHRTGGGQRRYERHVLRRLAFIRAARHVGLTLDEIRDALATLPESRTPNRTDWARISRGWRARLDAEIAALATLRDGLDSCIGCGCLSLQRCAISNPDDRVARSGAGARFLPAPLREDTHPMDSATGAVGVPGWSGGAAEDEVTGPDGTDVGADRCGVPDGGPGCGVGDGPAEEGSAGPLASAACDVSFACEEFAPDEPHDEKAVG